MNFFEHQDRARRSTGRLVLLFALAVIVIVVAVDAVVVALFATTEDAPLPIPALIALTSGVTILVILGGSLAKLAELSAGGRAIAESLRGRLVDSSTTEPNERRLLNVVEEMSIASGVPTPPVYVMDHERGINAFAAGYSPNDAVIGVTRGTLELLPRDELQGVMAHEYSHILNGDMRLNLRLVGVLHGIMLLSVIGNVIFRTAFYTGHGHRRRRGKDEGGGALAIFALGLALMLIGSLGSFFGSLIRAMVSRQREFLADASAVQFTRDSSGIADALKRIGGHTQKAYIDNSNAAESAHMFFGAAVVTGLSSMFATHPPLKDRIRRIDPSWDGKFLRTRPLPGEGEKAASKRRAGNRAEDLLGAIGLAGTMTEEHLQHAASLFHAIPPALKDGAHEPFGARAVVCALLLSANGLVRGKQMRALHAMGDMPLAREIERLTAPALALDASQRLPLLDIAIPALRSLSDRQLQVFDKQVQSLVEADGRLGVFEWALQRVFRHSLAEANAPSRRRTTHYGLQRLTEPCSALLSCVAYAGHTSTDEAQKAFDAGWGRLGLAKRDILPVDACGLHVLDQALDALEMVAPKAKKSLLEATAICVAFDRQVTTDESELLRAIAEAMGVPVPPVLPGQPLDDASTD